MKVTELNQEQLILLKQDYLATMIDGQISWGELANADNIITDNEIYAYFSGVEFSEDDF